MTMVKYEPEKVLNALELLDAARLMLTSCGHIARSGHVDGDPFPALGGACARRLLEVAIEKLPASHPWLKPSEET